MAGTLALVLPLPPPIPRPAKPRPSVHRICTIRSLPGRRYWASLPYDSGAANANLPVVENLKVPVRGIIVVMLVFIIVVGSGEHVCAGAQEQAHPDVALDHPGDFAGDHLHCSYSPTACCAKASRPAPALQASPFSTSRDITRRPLAPTGFYCPLTVRAAACVLTTRREATPPWSALDNYRSGSAREVDWTQTQHFTRGWLASRVPAHFHVRKSEVRRERLEWQKVNGGWQIINGLGERRSNRCGWRMKI